MQATDEPSEYRINEATFLPDLHVRNSFGGKKKFNANTVGLRCDDVSSALVEFSGEVICAIFLRRRTADIFQDRIVFQTRDSQGF